MSVTQICIWVLTLAFPTFLFLTPSHAQTSRARWSGPYAGFDVGGRFADDVAFQSALVQATQASTNESLYIFDDGYDFITNHNSLSGASQSSRSENAFGGGFGAAIDLSITPHWIIRGEYAFSVFPIISVHLPQSLVTASRLTFQPLLQAVRLGAIYNF